MANCPDDVTWSDLSMRERALLVLGVLGVALLVSLQEVRLP
mgnify:CR=1 FL=1